MAELIAQGPKPEQRWRRHLPADQIFALGRAAGDWSVPWDPFISGQHAQLTWQNGALVVDKLPAAGNPLFHLGHEVSKFSLQPGDHFVIGQTTFTLADNPISALPSDPPPFQERAVSARELQDIPFRNAPHQIDVLSRLPEVISGAANDQELFLRLGNMLLAGIRRAEAVAVVAVDSPVHDDSLVKVLHWDRRLARTGYFRPSQRLVRRALRGQQTVVHAWQAEVRRFRAWRAGVGQFTWRANPPATPLPPWVPPGKKTTWETI